MSTKVSTPTFSPELPRRVMDIPGSPRRRPGDGESEAVLAAPAGGNGLGAGAAAGAAVPDSGRSSDRRLIVGREISLAGEINSCDYLVVEGQIEAKLKKCRVIEVAEGGIFKGSADIDEADVGGRFEGDLTVQGRLRVRGTGVISGNIRYGQLEVEIGGQLIGTVQPREAQSPAAAVAARPEPALADFQVD